MRNNLHFPKLAYIGGGVRGGGGDPHVLVPKNTFTDVFDNTCDSSDFRAHIFRSQTTQELPKKHNEAGPPEQLPMSQIYYGHTRHYDPTMALPPSE